MKKKLNSFLIILTVVFIMSSILAQTSTVFAYGKSDKNNQKKAAGREKTEIIVGFKDKNTSEEIKNSTKKKLKVKKLKSKKKLKGHNSPNKQQNKEEKLVELLEVDSQDDIEEVINELKKNPDVEFAQPNYKLYTSTMPEDSRFDEQWALYNTGQTVGGQAGNQGIDINILEAWEITTGNKNVVVGILDSGVDINHKDLEENVYVNKNEIPDNGIDDDNNGYIDDINGWDFFNEDNSVYDSATADKHGTHVAGIVAAEANGIGIRGVAPNVKVLPLKFISGGFGYTSDAIEAIAYAESMGIKIINCSWGSSEYNYALKGAMYSSDILFICAAGNNGENVAEWPIYPASFDNENIISVAAIDNKGELASFSNYGEGVDIAAPGVRILSTIPENDYGTMSGTSMAVPHVAGTAALLLSEDSSGEINDISTKIKNNTTSIPKISEKTASEGLINVYKALYSFKNNISEGNELDELDPSIETPDSNVDGSSDVEANAIPKPGDPNKYINVTIESLTSDKSSPQDAGESIKWTCWAKVESSDKAMSVEELSQDLSNNSHSEEMITTNAVEFLTFSWKVYKGTEVVYSYSTSSSNVFTWTPNEPGGYKIKVTATHSSGNSGSKYSSVFIISGD